MWGMTLMLENQSTHSKTHHGATLSNTNPTWNGLD